ncbi:DUF1360 domain-containing protein [Actinomadura macrotermitis]|uniref:DUF1360 domain-containing protein n=1 Tax=Actinomadura macrotermitis TaxID=2585200 RepID=A0A7K0BYD8_9ACTN|nr:DUF1360 domain-containing protein [Actinomadura macrotermitis]MQY06189.1 hypothetical protein [Actinomadura macrotermitis]
MNAVADTVREQKRQYTRGADRPLGSYLTTLAVYGLSTAALTLLARRRGRRARPPGPGDLALMTLTTHKLSRMITKEPVTSPLRAPFTRYNGTSGPAELAEEVRGSGLRHTIGELVTCPFCVAQWVATGYAAGMVFAPDATRMVGTTMTAVAGSDWLQLAYARMQQAAEK